MRAKATATGFTNLRVRLKRFENAGKNSVHSVDVGVIPTARYPDDDDRGHAPTVAQVATWNEFGTKGGGWGGPVPARPFMRNTMHTAKNDQRALDVVRHGITAESPEFDEKTAERLGRVIQGIMLEEMKDEGLAPNAPATIALKKSSRPLHDTGLLRQTIGRPEGVRVNKTKPIDKDGSVVI